MTGVRTGEGTVQAAKMWEQRENINDIHKSFVQLIKTIQNNYNPQMLMFIHGASREYKRMIYINRWHEYKNAHLKHKIHQK